MKNLNFLNTFYSFPKNNKKKRSRNFSQLESESEDTYKLYDFLNILTDARRLLSLNSFTFRLSISLIGTASSAASANRTPPFLPTAGSKF